MFLPTITPFCTDHNSGCPSQPSRPLPSKSAMVSDRPFCGGTIRVSSAESAGRPSAIVPNRAKSNRKYIMAILGNTWRMMRVILPITNRPENQFPIDMLPFPQPTRRTNRRIGSIGHPTISCTVMNVTLKPPSRPPTETTWPAFVDSYGRATLEWFRQSGLPSADVKALVREFMAQLAPEFVAVANEPALRFRAWLQFAAHKCWCGLMEGRVEAADDGATSPQLALLLSVELHDAFLRALDAECTRARQRHILAQVQPLVEPPDWQVFRARRPPR